MYTIKWAYEEKNIILFWGQNSWGDGGHKMKALAFRLNSTKFCTHNQWAPRSIKMQKPTAQNGGGGGTQY